MQTVTSTYLDGIREGRSYMRTFGPIETNDMKRLRDNAAQVAKMNAGNAVAEFARGERDFWRNQLKKANS